MSGVPLHGADLAPRFCLADQFMMRGEHHGVVTCAGGHGDGCGELSHEL